MPVETVSIGVGEQGGQLLVRLLARFTVPGLMNGSTHRSRRVGLSHKYGHSRSLYASTSNLIGGIMQFKRAAGLYVAGICLFLGGPLLAYGASMFGAWSAFIGDQEQLTGLFIGIAVFGILLGVIGFFMLIVAAYRALVKIDALQVGAAAQRSERWTSAR
jgi:hypothetical protein